MTHTGTLSSKGQITIPIEVRSRLGLREGDKIEFITEAGVTTIRPARAPDTNPFAEFRAALAGKLPRTIEGIVREERRNRGR